MIYRSRSISCFFASDNTMFVEHEKNVSEYTLDGALVRHLVNKQGGINRPAGVIVYSSIPLGNP